MLANSKPLSLIEKRPIKEVLKTVEMERKIHLEPFKVQLWHLHPSYLK